MVTPEYARAYIAEIHELAHRTHHRGPSLLSRLLRRLAR